MKALLVNYKSVNNQTVVGEVEALNPKIACKMLEDSILKYGNNYKNTIDTYDIIREKDITNRFLHAMGLDWLKSSYTFELHSVMELTAYCDSDCSAYEQFYIMCTTKSVKNDLERVFNSLKR